LSLKKRGIRKKKEKEYLWDADSTFVHSNSWKTRFKRISSYFTSISPKVILKVLKRVIIFSSAQRHFFFHFLHFFDSEPCLNAWVIPFSALELGEELGRGDYGSVVKGRYAGSLVAVKINLERKDETECESTFAQEANILQGLRHPNIVLFSMSLKILIVV
jgi:hypothetical protein